MGKMSSNEGGTSGNDLEIFKVLKAKLTEMERAECELKNLQTQIDTLKAKQDY